MIVARVNIQIVVNFVFFNPINYNSTKMNDSIDSCSKSTKEVFQKQKLFIEGLVVDEDIDKYEKDLKIFFSKYGTIIDMRILQNSNLIRT